MKKQLVVILFLFAICNSFAQVHSIEFIENKGQWAEKIRYKAQLPAGNLYLEQNEITYQFYDEQGIARLDDLHHHRIKKPTENDYLLDLHAFKLTFLNANTENIVAEEPTSDYVNYYLGNDRTKWASKVKKFGKVEYQNLYPGIDLKYYLKGHHLKYDFIVGVNGNPENIKLKFDGQNELKIQDGDLKIKTSVNEMLEQKPYAFQIVNGEKQDVPCSFVLTDNVLSFSFPKGYDKTKELTIDPTLVFASYSGSNADNWGFTSTFDSLGNLYGGGVTFGVGYPTTVGAYQVNFAGGNGNYAGGCDISISKFSADGTNLIYSTYIGGVENESPHSLIVNSQNELMVLGTTASPDFPTTINAYDTSFAGGISYAGTIPNYVSGSDIFVLKLGINGSNLLGSTYIGGSANDGLNASPSLKYNYADEFRGEIIVDANDNVYVASSTNSNDFPVTAGVFQPSLSGMQDGCVFKLNSSLTNLMWSSFLGGTNDDAAYSLQFDDVGNILVTGGTQSPNFPVTIGALQTTYQNFGDGWISKINANATNIIASTFIGTTEYDQTYLVQLDSANNVYVLGQTEGTYPIFPSTVYNNPNSGQFLHKLSPNLSSTIVSTSFGTGSGEVDIALSAFLVNECNNILISGWGGSVNSSNALAQFSTTNGLPITSNAIQPITDGSDYYLMMLAEDADTLLYATFFGGSTSPDHVDGGTSRFDKKGIVYQAVCSSCYSSTNDFPTTPGAWADNDNMQNCNLGVFKMDLTTLSVDAELYTGPEHCFGDTVKFQNLSNGGVSYFWDFDDGNSSSEFEPSHVYDNPGTYNVMLIVKDAVTCLKQDTDFVEVIIKAPNVFVRPDTAVCLGAEITLWADGGTDHFWSPSIYITDPTSDTTTVTIYEPTIFNLDVTSDGCILDLEVKVDSLPNPTVNLGPDIETNWGSIVQLLSNSNASNYLYTPSEGLSCNTCPNPIVTSNESATYLLTVQNDNGCYNYDTITVIYDGSIYLPNAFTPNGDGKNDIFYAFGEDIVEFEMYIFNRWGEKLFYTDDMHVGWDGTFEGFLVQTETYVWKVNFKDIIGNTGEMYGTVTLIR